MRTIGILVGLLMLLPGVAHAYIGPGAGAGTIAVVLGVIASVFLAFVAILWYPFKRLIRRMKGTKDQPASDLSDPDAQ